MSTSENAKFYVIKLLEPSYSDSEKYVCVPNSWVRLRETLDGIAIVKFPKGELSEVKQLAKREEFSDDWPILLAEVKFGSNSYEESSQHIKMLNEISDQKEDMLKMIEDMPSTSNRSELELPSTSGRRGDTVSVSSETSEQSDLTDLENFQDEIDDSVSKPRRYVTRQSLRLSSSANNTDSLPNQTATDSLPDTSYGTEDNDKNNDKQENELLMEKRSELIRKQWTLKAVRPLVNNRCREVLVQLQNSFYSNHLILGTLSQTFFQKSQIIKEFIELMDNFTDNPNSETLLKELECNLAKLDLQSNEHNVVIISKTQNNPLKKEEIIKKVKITIH